MYNVAYIFKFVISLGNSYGMCMHDLVLIIINLSIKVILLLDELNWVIKLVIFWVVLEPKKKKKTTLFNVEQQFQCGKLRFKNCSVNIEQQSLRQFE